MANGKIELKVSNDDQDVAYLSLPRHPGSTGRKVVEKQLAVRDIISNYKGPSVYLDFDSGGHLIGIEIVD